MPISNDPVTPSPPTTPGSPAAASPAGSGGGAGVRLFFFVPCPAFVAERDTPPRACVRLLPPLAVVATLLQCTAFSDPR